MDKPFVGWREWVAMPELSIPSIKAKIDTGARTSALHAQNIHAFQKDGQNWVSFEVYPVQLKNTSVLACAAPIKEKRTITDSGGHTEERYVIDTLLKIGDDQWPIELTLTNRDTMRFRMLLGRQALKNHLWVDPARSYLLGNTRPSSLKNKKTQ